MTTTPPLNKRGSATATLVDNMDFDGPLPPGVFSFYSDSTGPDAGILFGCPCGCGDMKSVNFRSGRRPAWSWDGNREKPTLTPSILNHQMDQTGRVVGEHWHGFLTNGEFRSC